MDRDDKELLQSVHQHWLGYIAHGSLTADSFEKVKNLATDTLKDIKNSTYPWSAVEESQPQNGTISAEDADMVARYKAKQAAFKRETTGK